jgi:hypothetical protein
MAILDDLGNLIGKAAALSLPGVVAAVALAVWLWPPLPEDSIEVAGICRNEACPVEWPPSNRAARRIELLNPAPTITIPLNSPSEEVGNIVAEAGRPACWTYQIILPKQTGVFNYETPVGIQSELDDQVQVYQQCQELEKAKQGKEDALIANITDRIKLLTTDLAKIDESFQGYAASENPLEERFNYKLEQRKEQIQRWQALAIKIQLIKQERLHRIEDLTRQQAILTARLADPGRLRPRQRFDEFIGALGSHVTGFITLALGWSLVLTPVNQAVLSLFYAAAYRDRWDDVRDDRGPSLMTLTRIAEQVSSGNQ